MERQPRVDARGLRPGPEELRSHVPFGAGGDSTRASPECCGRVARAFVAEGTRQDDLPEQQAIVYRVPGGGDVRVREEKFIWAADEHGLTRINTDKNSVLFIGVHLRSSAFICVHLRSSAAQAGNSVVKPFSTFNGVERIARLAGLSPSPFTRTVMAPGVRVART